MMIAECTSVSKRLLQVSRTIFRQFRKCNSTKADDVAMTGPVFIGRDIISPLDLTPHDIHSLLWTALDLKTQWTSVGRQEAFEEKFLQNRYVSLITSSCDPHLEGSLHRAVSLLGGEFSVTHVPYFEKGRERGCRDMGKLMSTYSDMLVIRSNEQAMIEEIADGANVAVLAAKTEKFSLLMGLADMMTIYECFLQLEDLTVAWVGPPQAMFNTYLAILPKLGMNFKHFSSIAEEFEASPALLNVGMQNCIRYNTEIHECSNPCQAIQKSDVVASSCTDSEVFNFGHNQTKEAALKWILLHELPRGKAGVSDQVFCSKNNLCWESHSNLTWIAMAIALRLFEDVLPCILRPTFENC